MFTSPEWEFLEANDLIHTGRLVPIYPLTRGLYPRQVRKWTKVVIDGWAWQIDDFLPDVIKTRSKILDLVDAITQIHFPSNQFMAAEARKRLAFDELFLLQLSVLSRKQNWQQSQPGNEFTIPAEFISSFIHSLPFTLTKAQEHVFAEISSDLKLPIPMLRLLQGEVGSGKTVIAIFALLVAINNNYQGALMAPTEVLAEQHFKNICNYFLENGYQEHNEANCTIFNINFLHHPITIALLIGSLKPDEKRRLQLKIENGEINLVIGTHALIQEGVKFRKLGLAVIDEQQRFGVLQRSALRQKGFNPHILIMTATPIPRTMALTIYGDLDLSIINELPPGRKQVKTLCLEPKDIQKAYSLIRQQINHAKQAFIVCPLIEESEILDVKAAIAEYKYLSHQIFPDFKLGLLHGRIPSAEKENVMRRFHAGEIDILVSTSVIEVGIDIPNATVMLVEAADRFGLSQLHQLRGRVGRSAAQSYCILVPEKTLTTSRLQLMETFHDGFALAEKDLEIRGPGDFFGTLQSGLPPLKIAKFADLYLLEKARFEAINLFKEDHNLERTEHHALKKRLSQMKYQNTDWS
jgi:ATP-dependent DNA helicase RecG